MSYKPQCRQQRVKWISRPRGRSHIRGTDLEAREPPSSGYQVTRKEHGGRDQKSLRSPSEVVSSPSAIAKHAGSESDTPPHPGEAFACIQCAV